MLDSDALKRALDRAGVRVECPVCGTNVWSSGSEYVLLQAVSDDMDVKIGRGYLAYQLRCDNCGFYRLHSAEVIDAKAKEAEGEEGPDNNEDSAKEAG